MIWRKLINFGRQPETIYTKIYKLTQTERKTTETESTSQKHLNGSVFFISFLQRFFRHGISGFHAKLHVSSFYY